MGEMKFSLKPLKNRDSKTVQGRYEIPVREMISKIVEELPDEFSASDIIKKVHQKWPNVLSNTIRCHVIGMSPDHPSSKHYNQRLKLFNYLGNGRYRLLSETKIPIQPKSTSLRLKDRVTSRDDADRLITLGMYSQAIRECGTELEDLFKKLYQRYLPFLPYQEKAKAVDYEKLKQKSVEKFTIGEWLGLFKEASIFDYISQKKGKEELIFFTPSIIDTINKLRNISTHAKEGSECYLNRGSAVFVSSTIACILNELNE